MTKRYSLLPVSVVSAALILGLMRAVSAGEAGGVAARIGSLEIKVEDIQRLLDSQANSGGGIAMAELSDTVRQEAVRKMLLAKAKSSGIDKTPEIKNRIERTVEQVLVNAYLEQQSQPSPGFPSEEAVKAVYEANTATFTVPASMHIMQIYGAVPGDAPEAREKSVKATMDAVADSARKGNASFSILAQGYSEDQESAQHGGDLGWLRADQLRPEFNAVLKSMKPGEISAPVRGPAGWHVLKLVERKDARPMPLAEAHDAIVQALRRKLVQEKQLAYLHKLLEENPVAVDEIALSKLVQTKK